MALLAWIIVFAALALAGCSPPSLTAPTSPTPALAPSPAGQSSPAARATSAPATPTAAPSSTQIVWPVFDFDPARSGINSQERTIDAANVARLAVLWRQHLPSVADSTPVYRDGRLFLTTLDGSTVALDARTGDHLWRATTRGPKITNSSPAIDPSGQWVYGYGLDGFVHKYAARTGREDTTGGWPVRITRLTDVEKESSALNLANGKLYVTTSGYLGDQGHYDGHLVVIDLSNAHSTVFNTLCSTIATLLVDQPDQRNYCSNVQSGVWARAGAVIDPTTGNAFIVTGNGDWNGKTNWGDSVLEISPDGRRLLDSYTPTNQVELDTRDIDFGSTAPALFPEQPASATPFMAVQGGKDGKLRLLNRRNLSGKGGPGHLGGELQIVDAPGTCDVFTAPAVWTSPDRATWLFVADNCGLAGFKLVTDSDGQSKLVQQWQNQTGGTSPIIANGVLYVAHSGAVDARAPTTGRLLWTSPRAGSLGVIGAIHWESPIVVNGRLFISDQSGNVTALGLAGG